MNSRPPNLPSELLLSALDSMYPTLSLTHSPACEKLAFFFSCRLLWPFLWGTDFWIEELFPTRKRESEERKKHSLSKPACRLAFSLCLPVNLFSPTLFSCFCFFLFLFFAFYLSSWSRKTISKIFPFSYSRTPDHLQLNLTAWTAKKRTRMTMMAVQNQWTKIRCRNKSLEAASVVRGTDNTLLRRLIITKFQTATSTAWMEKQFLTPVWLSHLGLRQQETRC